jgi:Raf kinase inhibitor-like YbhB/YbcL family protein
MRARVRESARAGGIGLIALSFLVLANAADAQRGSGGGRAVTMTLTTTAFNDGGVIPNKFTQAGDQVSPALAWTGAPDSAKSYVLIMHDIDVASGPAGEDVLHWLAWNIPGNATSLPEGMPQGGDQPNGMRQISVSGPMYRGPGAPPTGPLHHYVFELYALDVTIDVPAVGQTPQATRAAVMAAMQGHIRGKGVLVGLFKRP